MKKILIALMIALNTSSAFAGNLDSIKKSNPDLYKHLLQGIGQIGQVHKYNEQCPALTPNFHKFDLNTLEQEMEYVFGPKKYKQLLKLNENFWNFKDQKTCDWVSKYFELGVQNAYQAFDKWNESFSDDKDTGETE